MTNEELAKKLLHEIRAWTPGPDYPTSKHSTTDRPFKDVFHFDNEAMPLILAYADDIRRECRRDAFEAGYVSGYISKTLKLEFVEEAFIRWEDTADKEAGE